jgi:hypothetical protein
MSSMDAALKVLRIIQVALISSVVLCMLVGEIAGKHQSVGNSGIAIAIAGMAATTVVIVVMLRRAMLMPAALVVSTNGAEGAAITRWKAANIVVLALCESIGVYGFVLRFVGFTLMQAMPFYLAAILMMLYFGPRRPVTQ